MSEPVTVLEYARAGVWRPEVSRLIREEMEGGGVRLVDPAVGWGGVMANVVACAGGAVFAAILATAVIMDLASGGRTAGAWRLCVPVVIGALTWAPWTEARLRATRPTVIEASRERGLRVSQPALIRPESEWPVEELVDVGAAMAMLTLGGPMVSTVLIVPRRQLMPVRLLVNRDAREVRWVVGELRRALGMADGAA